MRIKDGTGSLADRLQARVASLSYTGPGQVHNTLSGDNIVAKKNATQKKEAAAKTTKATKATKAKPKAAPLPKLSIVMGRTLGRPIHRFAVRVNIGDTQHDALVMMRDDGAAEKKPPYNVEWAATEELGNFVNENLGDLKGFRFSAKHNKNALRPLLRRAIRPGGDAEPVWVPNQDSPSTIPTELQKELDERPPSPRYEPEAHAAWQAEQDAAAAAAAAAEQNQSEEQQAS